MSLLKKNELFGHVSNCGFIGLTFLTDIDLVSQRGFIITKKFHEK